MIILWTANEARKTNKFSYRRKTLKIKVIMREAAGGSSLS